MAGATTQEAPEAPARPGEPEIQLSDLRGTLRSFDVCSDAELDRMYRTKRHTIVADDSGWEL